MSKRKRLTIAALGAVGLLATLAPLAHAQASPEDGLVPADCETAVDPRDRCPAGTVKTPTVNDQPAFTTEQCVQIVRQNNESPSFDAYLDPHDGDIHTYSSERDRFEFRKCMTQHGQALGENWTGDGLKK